MTTLPTQVEWPDMAGHLEFNTSMSDVLVVLGAAGDAAPGFTPPSTRALGAGGALSLGPFGIALVTL
jgi:hypothetical protein